jgi:RNA polymerase sigma factor (sigma-70 family)
MEQRIRNLLVAVPRTVFFEDGFKRRGVDIARAKLELPEIRQGEKAKVLTRDQEFRLFRKYNYFRYRFARTVAGASWESAIADREGIAARLGKLPEATLSMAEGFAKKSNEFRNLILAHNMKLVFKPACRYGSEKTELGDRMISDARMHLIKAAEKFDYRRGLKFSTYCVNVIQNNLLRDYQTEKRRTERFGVDFLVVKDSACERNEGLDRISEYDLGFIARALSSVKDKERLVVEKLFGINGERVMLKDLASEMGVCTQTVRNMKYSAIKAMSGVEYDPVF